MGEKERRKEKYMHSKMPKRPDVTQVEVPNPGLTLPPNKAPKRDNGSDMDHMGEINTLKEKIISLEKQISAKNRELIAKDQEITQMKAKVFNEEKLIREKMKKMASAHDTKVTEMSDKLRSMQAELAKLRKTDNNNTQKRKTNSTNLFHDKNKKVAKVASRTASPLSRSRSRSRSPVREKPRSRSGSRSRSPASRKSRSLSPSGDREKGGADSRVGSPAPNMKAEVKSEVGGGEVGDRGGGGGGGGGQHRVKSPDDNTASSANHHSNSEDSSRSQSRSGSPPSSPMGMGP